MKDLEEIKEEEFINGFNQGKSFFVDYIMNWMDSPICQNYMTPEGMEILREQIEDFNNED